MVVRDSRIHSVASSDAKNIKTSIIREGDEIVISGHKWLGGVLIHTLYLCAHMSCRWISGAGDPRTKLHLVMGKSDPGNASPYNQQSVVIVPADAHGVKVIRPMRVLGYDDAPEGHCEVIYDNVRVPLSNLVLGWGKGFEVGIVYFCFLSADEFESRSSNVASGASNKRSRRFCPQLLCIDLDVSTTVCALSVQLKWRSIL